MIIKSILSLVKNQPLIFALFSLIQTLSILATVYLYCDVRSQRILLEEYKGTALNFEITYKKGIALSDIEKSIKDTFQQTQSPVSSITALIDEANNITAEYNYNSTQVDFGDPLTSDNDIVLSKLYAKDNNLSIGDEITFLNRKYTVSGLTLPAPSDTGAKQILFSSLNDDDKIYKLNIKLKSLPTKNEKNDFTDFLYQKFETASIIPPDERNYLNEYEFDLKLLVSFSVILLVIFNITFVYKYILLKRKNKLTVYSICGCTRIQAFNILLSEVLCYYIIHLTVALVIWFGFLKNILIREVVQFEFLDIVLPTAVYFIFALIAFVTTIIKYSKQTTIELLYSEKD